MRTIKKKDEMTMKKMKNGKSTIKRRIMRGKKITTNDNEI